MTINANVHGCGAGVPRTVDMMRPLTNTHVSAPLCALIERGLLAESFENRLSPAAAYERALDLQMCGGEGAQRAREAAVAAAAAAVDPMTQAVQQLISMIDGGEAGHLRGLQRTDSAVPVPSTDEARAAIEATEGRGGYDVGAAWSMLCGQHERRRRQQELEQQHAQQQQVAPQPLPTGAGVESDSVLVAELVGWGFTQEAVEAALEAAGGAKEAAVEILLSIGTLPPDR
jgi:hypothetical protein